MRKISELQCCAKLGLLLLIAPMLAIGQHSPMEGSAVLFKYEGKSLRDSDWGKIAVFQSALSESLKACGKQGIGVDSWFGNGTKNGIINLSTCPDFEKFAVPESHRLYGAVHVELWNRLLPNTPPPTVHERAFALAFTHEATDYDRVEWNYETDDDKSALTWGPFGATVGWGNEVRAVLKRLHAQQPDLLASTFGDEFAVVSELMEKEARAGYEIMKPVYQNPDRRREFKQRLQKLGATPAARAAYDWYAFESPEWLKPNLTRLYTLIPDAESAATEVDYAFFLDLGMHAGIKRSRIAAAKEAIAAKESEAGQSLSPAARRRVIAQVFADAVNQRWRADRIGRNVVFYVDEIGPDQLTEEEVNAWKRRTGRKASNFGLSDERNYFPDFLK